MLTGDEIKRGIVIALGIAAAAVAGGCRATGFCEASDECPAGQTCGAEGVCLPTPGGPGDPGTDPGGPGGTPIDRYDLDAERDFAIGHAATQLFLTDLNGDGLGDLIVVGNGASALLRRRDWGLEAPMPLPGSNDFRIAAVGDVDGDGRPDLVVAGNLPMTPLRVLLGNGDGTFRPAGTVATDGDAATLLLADLNGDGKADIAATVSINNSPGKALVHLSNGDGTFQAGRTSPVGMYPRGLTSADFTGDGRQDLVVLTQGDAKAGVLPGNGDGTFQAARLLDVTATAGLLGTADLNRDGKPDLVVAGSGALEVQLGNGDGTFQRLAPVASGGAAPRQLVFADLNGDKLLDVAASFGQSLALFRGKGDGGLESIPALTRDDAVGLAVGDLTGDGKADVALGAGAVAVLPGRGDFDFARRQLVNTRGADLGIGDLNRDGRDDLVLVNGTKSISLFLGNADGTFQSARYVETFAEARTVRVLDLDQDSKLDLLISTIYLPGFGDGTFQPTRNLGAPPEVGVVLGDLNGDGHLDAAGANANGTDLIVSLATADGVFPVMSQRTSVGEMMAYIAAGDVNGDGSLDIAAVVLKDSSVRLLLNRGDGTFRLGRVGLADPARSLAMGDLSGDGKSDLVLAGDNNGLFLLLGSQDEMLPSGRLIQGTKGCSFPSVVDLNGDGKLDVIARCPETMTANNMRILLGNGDGTFAPARSYVGDSRQLIVDHDRDGKLDLVVNGDFNVALLRNISR